MKPHSLVLFLFTVALGTSAATEQPFQQVENAERAFAATMASRDFQAFSQFIDEEAIFYTGPVPLQGKQQVLSWWKRYFDVPTAPFSWEPKQVEVIASGTLAHSSGPVYNSEGIAIAEFNSIWRLNEHGKWQVVFDKGAPLAQ